VHVKISFGSKDRAETDPFCTVKRFWDPKIKNFIDFLLILGIKSLKWDPKYYNYVASQDEMGGFSIRFKNFGILIYLILVKIGMTLFFK